MSPPLQTSPCPLILSLQTPSSQRLASASSTPPVTSSCSNPRPPPPQLLYSLEMSVLLSPTLDLGCETEHHFFCFILLNPPMAFRQTTTSTFSFLNPSVINSTPPLTCPFSASLLPAPLLHPPHGHDHAHAHRFSPQPSVPPPLHTHFPPLQVTDMPGSLPMPLPDSRH